MTKKLNKVNRREFVKSGLAASLVAPVVPTMIVPAWTATHTPNSAPAETSLATSLAVCVQTPATSSKMYVEPPLFASSSS